MYSLSTKRILRFLEINLLILPLLLLSASANEFDHSQWGHLLQQHVSEKSNNTHATVVDYQGMLADRDQLKQYLQALTALDKPEFDKMKASSQLAFLINAYNAWTIELVLTSYPELDSIKDLGSLFTSPWRRNFIPIFGERLSLDDIEHSLIRGSDRYSEPRIHFAVNCASISCPSLRAEAYEGDRLDKQLEQQTLFFLSNTDHNRLDGDVLKLSPIFKWYLDDFEKGWHDTHSLSEFLARYAVPLGLSQEHIKQLQKHNLKIKFLDYDWGLNSKK
ncbi:MAG: DUF547 domain-containing protein [Gammaproteobacteria bacterium]|nr:DUF547 domain-containing protein [Gammaproteobacteria bacterium]